MRLSRSEAAGRNGAKSTRDAASHGLLAGAAVLSNENPAEFNALRDEYYRDYQPATATERDLVDEMVVAKWRQRRSWVLETAAIDHQMDIDAGNVAAAFEYIDEPTRSVLAIEQRLGKTRDLDVYERYDRRLHRQYHRALQTLLALRKQFGQTNPSAPATEPPACA